jgi:hypothetical protein
MPAQKF